MLSTLEVFDFGSSCFGELPNTIDAVVAIGGNDEGAVGTEREALSDKLERRGRICGEYTNVVFRWCPEIV